MYITIKTLNKNLGKFIELQDLFVGLPILFIFLILFSIESTRVFSLVILITGLFMLIPTFVSNKNRMYKLVGLVIKYLFKRKNYIYFEDDKEVKKLNGYISKIKKR
ncbi:MAG: hypothetical protein R3Y21_03800 [Mycoplasmatota bacterium]